MPSELAIEGAENRCIHIIKEVGIPKVYHPAIKEGKVTCKKENKPVVNLPSKEDMKKVISNPKETLTWEKHVSQLCFKT